MANQHEQHEFMTPSDIGERREGAVAAEVAAVASTALIGT